jgi:hypothetical protein
VRVVVGSILTTVKEGDMVDRADELGYFAFGRLSHSELEGNEADERFKGDLLLFACLKRGRWNGMRICCRLGERLLRRL